MATQNRIPTLGFGASIAAVVLLGFGRSAATTAVVRQVNGVAWAATPTAAASWPAVGTSPAWPSTPAPEEGY